MADCKTNFKFFSRLAAAQIRHQAGQGHHDVDVDASEEDFRTWESSENEERLRKSVYAEIDTSHPIVFGDSNVCTLITQGKGKSKRISELKDLCENFGLKVEGPESRKDSFIKVPNSLVGQCKCTCTNKGGSENETYM